MSDEQVYDEPNDVIPGLTAPLPQTQNAGTNAGSGGVPFGDPADEAAKISINMFTPEDSVEDVEKARYRQAPLGKRVLAVVEVVPQGDPKPVMSYVRLKDGRVERRDYVSQAVRIKLAVPGDDRCSVSFFLQMPPASKPELESYIHGFGKPEWAADGKASDAGREYRRFIQWLGRLGFKQDANQNFPREAFHAPNWIYYPGTKVHRLIGCEVIPGKAKDPFVDESGKLVTPRAYNQVANFSFEEVPPPPAVLVGAHSQPAVHPAAEPQQSEEPPAPATKGAKGRKAPVAV